MKWASTSETRIRKVREGRAEDAGDVVAKEEPLEIRIVVPGDGGDDSYSSSVTMRTPGNDFELAAGFLFTEGILRRREDLDRIEYHVPREQEYNIVNVVLKEGVSLDTSLTLRSFYTTSACGVCGKSTLEAVKVRKPPWLPSNRPRVDARVLERWPATLRAKQRVFDRTGGLHAAALFREDGALVSLREDVGRHNAVDKLVGQRFLEGELPLGRYALVVSGRASFEIVQKALAAGIPFVAAVGAPSSLAIDVAREFGMTLVGFLRGSSFNVYVGAHRLAT